MSRQRLLLMSLLSTALFFLSTEGLLRLIYDTSDFYFSWEKPDGLIVVQGTGEVYARPHSEATVEDGPVTWAYQTNGEGFRESAPQPLKRDPKSLRILALGDSWMFGLNANQEKTIPSQLERLLPPMMGGTPIDVINAGIPGACAFDMLRFYRQIVARYEIDGILISNPHNRERQRALKENRVDWYKSVRKPPFIKSHIYLFLRKFYAPYAMPQFKTGEYKFVDRMVQEDLLAIARDAKGRKLPMWALFVPTNWPEVKAGIREDHTPFIQELEALNVRVTGHPLPDRSCWGWHDIVHPSEAGYAVIAQRAAQMIATGQSQDPKIGPNACLETGERGPGVPGYPTDKMRDADAATWKPGR